jgi:hypothetical protein
MVMIGHVTSLIEHIATVKSSITHGFSTLFSSVSDDIEGFNDEENLPDTTLGLNLLGSSYGFMALPLSSPGSLRGSDSAQFPVISILCIKAFSGPFLFIPQFTIPNNQPNT